MNLYKEDLMIIGHTIYQEQGFTNFLCSGTTSRIEGLLLREILKLHGDNGYEITETRDYHESTEDEPAEIVFHTDMPWSYFNRNF